MLMELTEEQRMLKDTAKDFADNELAPIAAKLDREKAIPRELLKKMADIGLLSIIIPEKYGGVGLGNFELVLALEEINRVCASTGVTVSVHASLCTSPILRFGNDEQKQRYLPRLATGEILGAYALTEANAGSDAASLETTARKDGNDYVLNGSKMFITNGGIAELIIVFARTNPDKSLRAKGITAFFVEAGYKGFKVGKKEEKLGISASNTVELIFEDCRVPKENILFEENKGFTVAMDTLDGGRIGIATQALGIAQASLDASVKYANQRKQFGKFISEFQAIQWKLADMATDIDAARMLVYRAAMMRDKKVPHTREAAMAKLFASTMANKAAKEAVQIHGGVGYTKEFPVERFFRDAKITEIYEGTSEVQRIVISRAVLGKK